MAVDVMREYIKQRGVWFGTNKQRKEAVMWWDGMKWDEVGWKAGSRYNKLDRRRMEWLHLYTLRMQLSR